MPIFTSQFVNGTLVHYFSDTTRMVPESLSYSVSAVTCGSNEIFILTSDGKVWHYGDCFSNTKSRCKLLPLPKITHMHCKNKHIMFVTDDGILYARGYNGYGQLVQVFKKLTNIEREMGAQWNTLNHIKLKHLERLHWQRVVDGMYVEICSVCNNSRLF